MSKENSKNAPKAKGKVKEEKQELLQNTQQEEVSVKEESLQPAQNRRERLSDAQSRERDRELRADSKSRFLASWAGLMSAKNEGRIVLGTAGTVYVADLKPTNSSDLGSAVFLNVFHDNIKVMIPFQEIYRRFPIDLTSVDLSTDNGKASYISRQRAMAEKLYGCEIPFTVEDMKVTDTLDPENDYAIFGSRAKALEIIENRNYLPDKKGFVKIKEGDFVDAVVISTSKRGLQANVAGVDTIISTWALTYRFVKDSSWISTHYPVGSTIRVQVFSIERGEDGIHNIKVSGKNAELEEAKRCPIPLNVGERTFATITNIIPSKVNPNRVRVMMYLDSVNRPAYSNNVQPSVMGVYPKPGDTIRVSIAEFKENGMIRVAAVQQHGAADFFSR